MPSVGERLRKERIAQGLDLASLATRTRINQRYLEAIENGDISGLPSGFFYRSFVRQYASVLGLDPSEIEDELQRERQNEAAVLDAALQEAEFPIKQPDPIVSESNRRYLGTGAVGAYVALLFAVLVGCSVVYAWWHRYEAARTGDVNTVVKAAVEKPPAPSMTPAPVQPPAVSQPASPASDPSAANQPPALESGVTFAGVSSTPPTPRVPPLAPDDRVVVKLAATEVTWVSVTADGKYVFSGLLQPNQSVTLGGKERTQVKIGNAGGLEISWNGKPIGSPGPRGQVRTLLLTPENYRIIAPDGSL